MTVFHKNLLSATVCTLGNIYNNVKLTVEKDESSEALKHFILKHMGDLKLVINFLDKLEDYFLDFDD